jgi:carbonic anhydrase
MLLFEAIIDANHRALAGDANAGIHPADFADTLPLAALTCIDPRLNALLPAVLGLPADQFVWLRNAGNIITGPVSSTMRSLALACAVKGAREVAVIGHTDCQVRKTSIMELTERFRALGVDRGRLPENLTEFFGVFASERQNVLKGAEIVRSSPLISPRVPVHGLLLDIQSGRVDWLVNGYETLSRAGGQQPPASQSGQVTDFLAALPEFQFGEMKFPEGKIGETAAKLEAAASWAAEKAQEIGQAAERVEEVARQFHARFERPGKSAAAPISGATLPPPPPGKPGAIRVPIPPPIPRPGNRPKGGR